MKLSFLRGKRRCIQGIKFFPSLVDLQMQIATPFHPFEKKKRE